MALPPHVEPREGATDALTTDVLVIGAGPAGSAAALRLARQGLQVLLADRHPFPRDKVCGDGLIPDALRALERLGLLKTVLARARRCTHVGCIGPSGGRVDVPGRLAVLPRRELDDILCRAARDAGASWLAPWRMSTLRREGGRVVGACGRAADGKDLRVSARWTVLATGASAEALEAAGVCERRHPSGMAMRGYVRHPALAERMHTMDIVWHRALAGGYGWIFPGPDATFNVGAGIGHEVRPDANLRELFATFRRIHPDAERLVAEGEWIGPLKGAPLRCSLTGSKAAEPGLLVTGEAIGSTYSFTGEGIGKAMETGMLAAEAIAHGADDAAVIAAHQAGLAQLKPRFDLYDKAQGVNRHPWLVDLVIHRARRSERILERMAGVLEERSNPGNLLSLRGLARLMLPLH